MFGLKNQRLLVIAPHPDDEVIGCGGLIKRVKDHGGKVYVMYLTVGDTQDFSKKGKSTIAQRMRELEAVVTYLRIDRYSIEFSGDDYHLQLDLLGQRELMHHFERSSAVSVEKVKPTIVAFPSVYSYNQDHRIAAHAVHAALRPSEAVTKFVVPTVIAYEVPADSWSLHHQNVPNFFVPLGRTELNAKLHALALYTSQNRPSPNPRSPDVLTALASLRGSLCASAFAEAFISYRSTI